MQQRQLGRNGPRVSALGLGCMGMSISYGTPDDEESVATIQRAIDLGVNLIVTSDAYGNGVNEALVGRAIKGRRSQVLVATKFGNLALAARGGEAAAPALSGGHPDYVPQACDRSLQRLGVDVIDVYGLHRVDKTVPIEDTVGAMKRLVEQGKVRHLQLSEAGVSDAAPGAPRAPDRGAGDGVLAVEPRRRDRDPAGCVANSASASWRTRRSAAAS